MSFSIPSQSVNKTMPCSLQSATNTKPPPCSGQEPATSTPVSVPNSGPPNASATTSESAPNTTSTTAPPNTFQVPVPVPEVPSSASHLQYVPPEVPDPSSTQDPSVSGSKFSVGIGDLYGCKDTNFKSTVSLESARDNWSKHLQSKEAQKRESMLEKHQKQADLMQRMKLHTEEVDSLTEAKEDALVDEALHHQKHEAERKEDVEFFENLEQNMMTNA
jgi:hypothetical protein